MGFRVILYFVMPALSLQTESTPNPSEMVEMVINRIEQNYSEVKTYRFAASRTIEDSRPIKEKKTVLPNGGYFINSSQPKLTVDFSCLFKGTLQKYEASWPNGRRQKTVVREKDSLEFHPDIDTAWRRPPGGMSQLPLDIREASMPSTNRPFMQFMRECKILEGKSTIDPQQRKIFRISMREEKSKQMISCDFIVHENLLPARVGFFDADTATLMFVTEFQNKELVKDKTWFPIKALRRTFKPGMTKEALDEGWNQRITWDVKGEVRINEEVQDSEFFPELPKGTAVRDAVDDKVYVTGPAEKPASNRPPRNGLLKVAAPLGAIVFLVLVFKRSRLHQGEKS